MALYIVTWCLSCFSGIPGKKCGTIIVRAEELSNCRVAITFTFSYVTQHEAQSEPLSVILSTTLPRGSKWAVNLPSNLSGVFNPEQMDWLTPEWLNDKMNFTCASALSKHLLQKGIRMSLCEAKETLGNNFELQHCSLKRPVYWAHLNIPFELVLVHCYRARAVLALPIMHL